MTEVAAPSGQQSQEAAIGCRGRGCVVEYRLGDPAFPIRCLGNRNGLLLWIVVWVRASAQRIDADHDDFAPAAKRRRDIADCRALRINMSPMARHSARAVNRS